MGTLCAETEPHNFQILPPEWWIWHRIRTYWVYWIRLQVMTVMIAIPINWSSNEPDTNFATQRTSESQITKVLLRQIWPTCFHQTDDNSDQITILRGKIFLPYPLYLNCQQKWQWFGLWWQRKRWRWYDEDHLNLLIPPGPPVCSIRGIVPVSKRVSRTVEQIQRERENHQEAYCHRGEHRGGEREILE